MKNRKNLKKNKKTLKKKGFLLESGIVAPVDLIALVYVSKSLRSAFFLGDNHLAILVRSEKIRSSRGGHGGLRKEVHVGGAHGRGTFVFEKNDFTIIIFGERDPPYLYYEVGFDWLKFEFLPKKFMVSILIHIILKIVLNKF